jgi:hypothetical protein
MTFGLDHLFQAKWMKGEREISKDLLSISSGFSYDFEKDDQPLSNLSTRFQSSALPLISSLSGSMVHTFYNPDDGDLEFFSPYLLSFNVNANFRLAGKNFLFDDRDDEVSQRSSRIARGADSVSQLTNLEPTTSGRYSGQRKGWSLTATYSYRESGRGNFWSKSSFINLSLRFNLTPSTAISYTQRYDITRNLTISNSVNIVRQIHCWSGSLYWVPIGSNRGFGFKLYVTDIPEIKIDSNHDTFLESISQ